MPKEEDWLGCKALPRNRIRIFIVKRGKEVASIDLAGKNVGKVVAAVLGASITAAQKSGQMLSNKQLAELGRILLAGSASKKWAAPQ